MNMFLLSWLVLLGAALIMLSYIIYRVVKNEKRRKEYSTNMKVGDRVYVSIIGNGIIGDISKIDGEDVYVTIKKNKKDIYPN